MPQKILLSRQDDLDRDPNPIRFTTKIRIHFGPKFLGEIGTSTGRYQAQSPEKYLGLSPEKYLGLSPEKNLGLSPEKYLGLSPEKQVPRVVAGEIPGVVAGEHDRPLQEGQRSHVRYLGHFRLHEERLQGKEKGTLILQVSEVMRKICCDYFFKNVLANFRQ